MTIVIDPGHGGRDPGAVYQGYREKDQVLAISKRIKEQLNYKGIRCTLTRENDEFLSLLDRADKLRSIKDASLFVSIHFNASASRKGTGMETYRVNRANRAISEQSKRPQELIHKEIAELNRKYNIRDRGMKEANFYVLRNSNKPAVLIEVLFIDNDMKLIENTNYYFEVATSIAFAIEKYINN